jgi:RimJ/RimL family protein N-acetyltransferase
MGEDREPDGGRDLTPPPPRIVDGVLYGADVPVARWVERRVAGYTLHGGERALGVLRGEKLVAGVIYDRFNGIHIEATIAAEAGSAWARRAVLRHLFGYPFHQLGCLAISVVVPSTNRASLNLATKLGFTPEAIVRFAAHDGSSLVVLKMFRDNCKWIGDHGQEEQQGTGGA